MSNTEPQKLKSFGLVGSIENGNPINEENTTDEERAQILLNYLQSIVGIAPNLKLMPLGEDGKNPIIEGKCRLNSEAADKFLKTPKEAVEAIKRGYPGFVLYAGNENHGTEDLCFTDIDDPEIWSPEDTPETLTVMSGSGRGFHGTHINEGVNNAKGKGDYKGAGEVRADNWYVVLPGSIHPSGGIYHTVHDPGEIGGLKPENLPEELQPGRVSIKYIPDVEITSESINGELVDKVLLTIRDYFHDEETTERAIWWLHNMMNGKYEKLGFDQEGHSRSEAEVAFFSRLYGIMRKYTNMGMKESAEAVSEYITQCCHQHEYTDGGNPRKWVYRVNGYREDVAEYAISTFDPDIWTRAQRKKDEWDKDGDYSDIIYSVVLQSVKELAEDHGEYPTRKEIVARAQEKNPSRAKDSHRRVLIRLRDNEGEITMAHLGGNDYVYFPSDMPVPKEAEYIKIEGEEINPEFDENDDVSFPSNSITYCPPIHTPRKRIHAGVYDNRERIRESETLLEPIE